MATWKSNTYEGRYLQLEILETVNHASNTSTLKWTLSSVGGSSSYYSIAATTVTINGQNVYSKGQTLWSAQTFPAAKGSTSGTVTVTHDSDGRKTISVVFNTSVYTLTPNSYGGTLKLTDIDRVGPTVTITTSGVGPSGFTVKATASTTCDRWDYQLNGAGWKNFSTTSGTSATANITGLSPDTSYTVTVRARKSTNQIYGTSGSASVKTYGASALSSVSTFTADNATAKIELSATVYSSSFTHTLTITNGGSTVLTITGLKINNGANTITLNASQRSSVLVAMAKIQSFTGTFTLTTYNGSSQVGTASSKTATVRTTAANSGPTFPGFTYADINSVTTAITGNNKVLIQEASRLRVTATAATAKNGASISSYSAVAGNMTASSTTTTIDVGAVRTSGTVPIVVTAIDSRGYTASATINATVIAYESVDIASYLLRRINEVEAATQVTIEGKLSALVIGGENKNALQYLRYRYRKTNETEWGGYVDLTESTTKDERSFSFSSDEWISLDVDYSYYVEFVAGDNLTTDTVTITLPQGTPLLSFRRKKIGINKRDPETALDVDGIIKMNGFNVMGYIEPLGATDLNEVFESGIYFQMSDGEASVDRHYPDYYAGFLEVLTATMANGKTAIMQRYTCAGIPTVSVRFWINGAWDNWYKVKTERVIGG